MPEPNSAYDFVLNGQGYLLARNSRGAGRRGWQEDTVAASTAARTVTEHQYGNLEATVLAPMVWRTAHRGYGDRLQRGEGRYYYANNMDCRVPEQILPGPKVTAISTVGGSANVNRIIEFDGKLFVLAGRYCKRINSDDSVSLEQDFGAGKVAVDAEVFNGVLYVSLGFGAGDYLWKRTTGASWTQDDDVQLGYMALWKERLWGQKSTTLNGVTTNQGVQNVSNNPFTAADWSANGPIVGDPGSIITSMGSLGDMLYVGKTDGLHGADASAIAPLLTPEMRPYTHSDNCRGMTAWHGMWFVPHLRGLLTYRDMGEGGFLVSDASPGRDADRDNPARGLITAMAGDDHWLYAALYTPAGHTYILAGREAAGEELQNGNMVWHPLALLQSTKCQAMHVCGIFTNPRLYYGMNGELGYIILPRNGDNPTADTNCRYATAGSIYLPAHAWNAPASVKVWKEVRIESENLSLGRYLYVYYSLDGGTWTALGLVNVSPHQVLALPDGGVSGSDLRLRLDYVCTETRAFVIRSIVAVGAERPDTLLQFVALVRCATGLATRSGGKCPRTAATIREELYALAAYRKAVRLIDPIGVEHYVLVQPHLVATEAEQEGKLDRELSLQVTMTEFEARNTPWARGEIAVYGTSLYGGGHIYT